MAVPAQPQADVRPPARLVLFVGAAAWPDAALATQLMRHGVRQRCVDDLAAARHVGSALRFDACVIEQRLALRAEASDLARLAAGLACPLLLVPVLERPVAAAPGAAVLWHSLPRHRLLPALLDLSAQAVQPRANPAANDDAPAGPGAPAAPTAPAAGAVPGWRYDPARRLLHNGSVVVGLTPMLGGIAQLLLDHPGMPVAVAQIQHRMRELGYRTTPGGLRTSVSRLRMALLSQPRAGLTVTARRRQGYSLRPTPASGRTNPS